MRRLFLSRDPEASGGLSDCGYIDAANLSSVMGMMSNLVACVLTAEHAIAEAIFTQGSRFVLPAAGLHDVSLQHHCEDLGKWGKLHESE